MANTLKVKLNRGIIVAGIDQPHSDERTYGEAGQTVELDKWTAMHLCNSNETEPAATLVSKK